jgi:hypothetical protein
MVDVADGGSADAWQIYWVPDFSAPASSVDVFAICTGVSRR